MMPVDLPLLDLPREQPVVLVFETAATTGAPTRVTVVPERDEQFVACLVADLPEEPALRDSGLVNAGNSLVDLPLMRVGPVLSSEAPIEGVS